MYGAEVKWRFFYKYEKDPITKCWNWLASCRKGYGQFRTGKEGSKVECAHITSYKIYRGDIPENMCVLHRCDNPKCVNPKHLFLGSRADNVEDCVTKKRKPLGEQLSFSKLNEIAVKDIRSSCSTGRSLAIKHNVSFQTISEAKLRKTWKHVA